jgi:hypothetical protein
MCDAVDVSRLLSLIASSFLNTVLGGLMEGHLFVVRCLVVDGRGFLGGISAFPLCWAEREFRESERSKVRMAWDNKRNTDSGQTLAPHLLPR